MRTQPPDPSPARARRLVFRVAIVLSLLIILCPPYSSLKGTEYALVFAGPGWSEEMGIVGTELGLGPRLNWGLLMIELAAVWAGVLVIRPLIGRERAAPLPIVMVLIVLPLAAHRSPGPPPHAAAPACTAGSSTHSLATTP